MQMIIL